VQVLGQSLAILGIVRVCDRYTAFIGNVLTRLSILVCSMKEHGNDQHSITGSSIRITPIPEGD
jgi:hypothetical protein